MIFDPIKPAIFSVNSYSVGKIAASPTEKRVLGRSITIIRENFARLVFLSELCRRIAKVYSLYRRQTEQKELKTGRM